MPKPNPADLRPVPIALFLDVDGTLLDLAPRPEAVAVPEGLRGALAGAEQRLAGALALISGRPIGQLDRLFAPLQLAAAGVHGAEIRVSAHAEPQSLTDARLPPEIWRNLQRLLRRFPGSFAEYKGVGFAVHHPADAASGERLYAALQEFVGALSSYQLEVQAGHCVIEATPAGIDKGSAIRFLMHRAPFAGRRPIFVADDNIDRAGFIAALSLGGLAFSVGAAMPGLSGWFAQPRAVRKWLQQLAQ